MNRRNAALSGLVIFSTLALSATGCNIDYGCGSDAQGALSKASSDDSCDAIPEEG